MNETIAKTLDPAAASLANARSLVAQHASPVPPTRLTALLVTSAGGGLFLASVWATEPEALPIRTRVAFALCLVIAFSWSAFAVHGLVRRRRLLVHQRVVAATMGIVFSAAFTALGLAVTLTQGKAGQSILVGATGATFVAIACLALLRARNVRRDLLSVRSTLQPR